MKFQVLKNLRLVDFDELVFLSPSAVYIAGDTIEVNANEARELLEVSAESFQPLDDLAETMVAQNAAQHNVDIEGGFLLDGDGQDHD